MIRATTTVAVALLAALPLPAFAQRADRPGLQTYVPAKQVVQLVDRYEAQKRTLIEWLQQGAKMRSERNDRAH
jgi:hypothetical protein